MSGSGWRPFLCGLRIVLFCSFSRVWPVREPGLALMSSIGLN